MSWGQNYYGQANVPSGLSNVIAVAAGYYHSLALKADGTVVSWGDGRYGQTNVPSRLSNVVTVATGFYHNLALNPDGTVVSWGSLGYNSSDQTNVTSGLSNVVALAVGWYHSLALCGDGPPWLAPHLADRWVLAGGTTFFTTAATGARPMSYQWRLNGANLPDATNATLVLTNAQPNQAGAYSVVASNAYGTATSSNALLTVLPMRITSEPQSLSVKAGSNCAFTVAVEGSAPISIQWYFNGAAIAGATASTYAITNVQLAHQGGYQAIATNTSGSVTSAVASLAVLAAPSIKGQPQSMNVLAGSNVTFFASAQGSAPMSWQWLYNGADIPGATNASYTLLNAQPANVGGYAAVAANSYGTNASAPEVLTVTSAGSVELQKPLLKGGVLNLSLPSCSGLLYTLQYKETLDQPAWVDLPAVAGTGASLTLSATNDANAQRYYRVKITPR